MSATIENYDDVCVLPSRIYHRTFQLIADEARERVMTDHPKVVIERVLATLEECLFLNMARVLLPDHNNVYLRIRYAHGLATEKRFVTYKIDEGITGFVFKSGQSIYIDDLDTNSMYIGRMTKPLDLPYSKPAFSGVPIKSTEGKTLGVLCVNHGYRNKIEINNTLVLLEETARIIAEILTLYDAR